MPQLVSPSDQYKASFLQALHEYQAEGLTHYLILDAEKLERDFGAYVALLQRQSRGESLPEGKVPHTELWLVEGDEFLGRVDIRHHLNPRLSQEGGHIGYDVRPTQRRKGYGKLALELGIAKARELGIEEVLVTCDVNNLASKKVIESNGGVLEDIQPMSTGKPDKARYTIKK